MSDERRGLVGRLQEAAEARTGKVVADSARIEQLEEAAKEGRALKRELDLIGWTALDFLSGQSQELKYEERRKLAQQARMVWSQDPQAGAAVDLSNDFVFGRGVQKPKFKDKEAQKILDEAWDDPDNKLVLTTFEAQVALNTDLELQSNVFLVMFDSGEDGRVKLGLLNHDEVETVVRDTDNRLRVLYYVASRTIIEWDYDNDRAVPQKEKMADGVKRRVWYYEHLTNVQEADKEGRDLKKPPEDKMGEGRVLHVAVNRTSEMAFGIPTMRRTIRWFTAYNDFMKARVDMAQAAAAFIMKRTAKASPGQLARLASRAVSQGDAPGAGPASASILNENESVKHDNMSLNSGAGNAVQDGQMIRSQISAATHFPQHYLGDAGSANLATATSMELPVLKHVEARQEVWEGVFRRFIDRVIEKAVEDGLLDENADVEVLDGEVVDGPSKELGAPQFNRPQGPAPEGYGFPTLSEAYQDQADDEAETKRDLSYEFAMPNPLKRTMTDLVSAVANIARTFDPNNTNPDLSRVLLGVVLSEGLELDDASGLVDSIYPEGYVDPAIAAAQAQQEMARQMAEQQSGFEGADGNQGSQGNPYGAPQQGTLPENVQEAMFNQQFAAHPVPSAWLGFARQLPEGDPFRKMVEAKLAPVTEARFTDLPEAMQLKGRGRVTDAERDFEATVGAEIDTALAGLVVGGSGHNGMNGN